MTLTLEITSEAVERRLKESALAHGRSVEEEALAVLSELPVSEAEYEERRRRATIRGPVHRNWDRLDALIARIGGNFPEKIERHPPQEREAIFP
jgi:hypothetical protein